MKTLLSLTVLLALGSRGFSQTEIKVDLPVPELFSDDYRLIPSLNIENLKDIDSSTVILSDSAVKEAARRNDVEQLGQLLAVKKTSTQVQAAKALGEVSEHKSTAQTLLLKFLAKNQSHHRTDFGDQMFDRFAVEAMARQSLAKLQSASNTGLFKLLALTAAITLGTLWLAWRTALKFNQVKKKTPGEL